MSSGKQGYGFARRMADSAALYLFAGLLAVVLKSVAWLRRGERGSGADY